MNTPEKAYEKGTPGNNDIEKTLQRRVHFWRDRGHDEGHDKPKID